MSGRPNTKWKETMLKRFDGNEAALSVYMKSLGSKGGKLSTTGGFAANPELARISGTLGGSRSKRGYKLVNGNYIKQ